MIVVMTSSPLMAIAIALVPRLVTRWRQDLVTLIAVFLLYVLTWPFRKRK
jgi:hypothetical protein